MTPDEIERGCKKISKLYPIALEMAELYKNGMSPGNIVKHFANKGHQITTGMISGYVNRNKLQRAVTMTAIEEERHRKALELSTQSDAEKAIAKAQLDETKRIEIQSRAAALIAYRKQHAEAVKRQAERKAAFELVSDNSPGKKLINMGMHQCWFHIGPRPDTPANQLFCGQKTSGKMFCEEHATVAYSPREERRKRA